MSLANLIKLSTTGPDNQTPDMARLLWVGTWLAWLLGFFAFTGMALAAWKAFNAHDFADGICRLIESASYLLAGGGLGVALKGHTEPKPND